MSFYFQVQSKEFDDFDRYKQLIKGLLNPVPFSWAAHVRVRRGFVESLRHEL